MKDFYTKLFPFPFPFRNEEHGMRNVATFHVPSFYGPNSGQQRQYHALLLLRRPPPWKQSTMSAWWHAENDEGEIKRCGSTQGKRWLSTWRGRMNST